VGQTGVLERLSVHSSLSKDEKAKSVLEYLSNPAIRSNLIVLMLCWLSGSFNCYLVQFQIKYFPGDVYVNTLAAAGSDIVSSFLSGMIYSSIGPRKSLFWFNATICLAGICIVIYEHRVGFHSNRTDLLFPALVLSA
jgi:hypothetical protein